ncbi:hypothetical protein KIN20_024581 [Parelaphostrongylus tenuis]|uniref:Uncharacterized protein n=1 Tax=Parelaphostrongylus tenuis TaxID=148309 RepID=A0AAD5QWD5_PARTN|nr:hypothetical protein KIN20_024581 [Parelaphostrongylus tenuis]
MTSTSDRVNTNNTGSAVIIAICYTNRSLKIVDVVVQACPIRSTATDAICCRTIEHMLGTRQDHLAIIVIE